MSTEVWKFILPVIDRPLVEMPVGAKVLIAAAQRLDLCVWAIVDPDENRETRAFCVRGTGHAMTGEEGAYVGSAMFDQGRMVFHVFEAKP